MQEYRDPSPLLQQIVPPGFVQVADGIYRSGFPDVLHLDIHEALGIKTILSLVHTDYPWANMHFNAKHHINVLNFPMLPNDLPDVKTPARTIDMVLSNLMSRQNRPIVIHCENGAHQTGCIVGCFRKLQGWNEQAIIKEYRDYAGTLARPLDEAFIKEYIPCPDMKRQEEDLNIAA